MGNHSQNEMMDHKCGGDRGEVIANL